MVRSTILLVAKPSRARDSTKDWLALQGHHFRVMTADDATEALTILESEVVHAVVIDLGADGAEGALGLSERIGPHFARLIYTHHSPDEGNLVSRCLQAADGVTWKGDDPVKLPNDLRDLIAQKKIFNPALQIGWTLGLNFATLVNRMKPMRDADRLIRRRARRILRDLTRRLFVDTLGVEFLRDMTGHSHCVTVLARPSYPHLGAALPLVVKFGPRQKIEQEVENWLTFVKNYVPNCPQLIEPRREIPSHVRSGGFAALAYKFAGQDVYAVADFRDFYRDGRNDAQALRAIIERLFNRSCGAWYRSEVSHKFERQPLDALYRRQLRMDSEARVAELRADIDRLISLSGEVFTPSGDGYLRVRIPERREVILPDPFAFIFGPHASSNGGDFFPSVYKTKVTHGDFHGGNILVNPAGDLWLVDFDSTGWGHALRDGAHLESDIKFKLFPSASLRDRYDLERTLCAPARLQNGFAFPEGEPSGQQARALAAIHQIRQHLHDLVDIEDAREHYIALLFYALKYVSGFSSAADASQDSPTSKQHALLSAAMLCDRLSEPPPALLVQTGPQPEKGVVFLAHEYQPPWEDTCRGLHAGLAGMGYKVFHPRDAEAGGGGLWDKLARLIDQSDAVLCETSSLNGNVFFELGYAIGRKRRYYLMIDDADAASHEPPRLLQNDLAIRYPSQKQLVRRVGESLGAVDGLAARYFFEGEQFAAREHRATPRDKQALALVGNADRQRDDLAPAVLGVLGELPAWRVEALHLADAYNLANFYLRLLEAELVVGCLSSGRERNAALVNAEVCLALGLALGQGKKLIVLQEEGRPVLTDLKSLTKLFHGLPDLERALREELEAKGITAGGRQRSVPL